MKESTKTVAASRCGMPGASLSAALPPIFSPSSASSRALREALRRRLLTLDFAAFAQCLYDLLTRLGYEDIQMSGRTQFRGHNWRGGYDLEARRRLSGTAKRRRMVVALKQFDGVAVYQRQVDELRGACLRVGADEALLVTTSSISPTAIRIAARTTAQNHRPAVPATVAPVRLIDGEKLTSLLVAHRIGVRAADAASGQERLTIDEDYFDELAPTLSPCGKCGKIGSRPQGRNTGNAERKSTNPGSSGSSRPPVLPGRVDLAASSEASSTPEWCVTLEVRAVTLQRQPQQRRKQGMHGPRRLPDDLDDLAAS